MTFTLPVNPTPDITFRHWLQGFTVETRTKKELTLTSRYNSTFIFFFYSPFLSFWLYHIGLNQPGLHQGFAIGNGLTNPEIQYGAYADYALDMKLISESDHDNLNRNYATCQQSIKECSKNPSTSFLSKTLQSL